MMFVRSLLFNLSFYLWTAFLAIMCLPLTLLPQKAVLWLSHFWIHSSLFLLRFFCGIRAEIRGLEYVPDGACIIAAKHQSAWETMMFCVLLNNPAFVLKESLMRIPFFGRYLQKLGMIAIDRSKGSKALKQIIIRGKEVAEQGRPIVIFPEGTRTAPGDHRKYQRGIETLYKNLKLPVVPAALNSGMYWSRNAFTKRPGVIVLEFLPPIAPGQAGDAFMEQLEQAVESRSQALVEG